MSMNVLDKDEECVVCLETMTLKQCSRYGCHLSCASAGIHLKSKPAMPTSHLQHLFTTDLQS